MWPWKYCYGSSMSNDELGRTVVSDWQTMCILYRLRFSRLNVLAVLSVLTDHRDIN